MLESAAWQLLALTLLPRIRSLGLSRCEPFARIRVHQRAPNFFSGEACPNTLLDRDQGRLPPVARNTDTNEGRSLFLLGQEQRGHRGCAVAHSLRLGCTGGGVTRTQAIGRPVGTGGDLARQPVPAASIPAAEARQAGSVNRLASGPRSRVRSSPRDGAAVGTLGVVLHRENI